MLKRSYLTPFFSNTECFNPEDNIDTSHCLFSWKQSFFGLLHMSEIQLHLKPTSNKK